MSDFISRQKAIEAIDDVDYYHQNRNGDMVHGANPDEHQAWYKIQDVYEALDGVPSAQPERKKGKWEEKHHAYSDEESVIEEWQSCKCSACGRYDTRPYMYYFNEPNYCSYCGADMRQREEA